MNTKPKKKVYSESDKLAALAVLAGEGGNESRAARITGIPRRTLGQWAKGTTGVKSIENLPAKVETGKLELADKLDDIAHALADSIPGKIADAKLRDTSISLGIAIDKRNLLRGLATSITETRMSDKQRIEHAIKMMIEETKAMTGELIDRAEAIKLLSAWSPEFQKAEETYQEA